MTAMTPVPKDDPLMVAWEAHQQTPEFENSKKWAAVPEHLQGSLWAVFVAGWNARAPFALPTDATPEIDSAEKLARLFHDTYEELAPSFGYETRQETRQFDPESPNGRLMIAVCREISRDLERQRNALQKELEEERTVNRRQHHSAQESIEALNSEIEMLEAKLAEREAEIAQLRKDARRYRWLRNEFNGDTWLMHSLGHIAPESATEESQMSPDELDAAIDAKEEG